MAEVKGKAEPRGLERFKGQDCCKHGVPVGLHATATKLGHDCEYTDARQKLIPTAEKALRAAGIRTDDARHGALFGAEMDRLTREVLFGQAPVRAQARAA